MVERTQRQKEIDKIVDLYFDLPQENVDESLRNMFLMWLFAPEDAELKDNALRRKFDDLMDTDDILADLVGEEML